jgi:hypothetical protein
MLLVVKFENIDSEPLLEVALDLAVEKKAFAFPCEEYSLILMFYSFYPADIGEASNRLFNMFGR